MDYKFRYIDCKQCGYRSTLQIYTGHALSRVSENIMCPQCGKDSTYSGDDFMMSDGTPPLLKDEEIAFAI